MREKHGALYSRRGAGSLAAGSLAGWLSGVIVELPHPVVGVLFGLVAGGVIANTVISELPREKQGWFGPSLMGAALCTAVLLLAGYPPAGGRVVTRRVQMRTVGRAAGDPRMSEEGSGPQREASPARSSARGVGVFALSSLVMKR